MKPGEAMKRVASASPSPSSTEAPSWLQPVYAARHQRTVDLLSQSIKTLGRTSQRISLTSIVAISKDIDPSGKGISESAILHNEAARALYEQHRTWKPLPRTRRSRPGSASSAAAVSQAADHLPHAPKVDRDLLRARQRYLRMSKARLVARLLAAEQEYADERDRWLRTNDALFTWMRLVDWLIARVARTGQDVLA